MITTWETYVPTYTGFGTVGTSNMRWRRVGSSLEVAGHFASGTVTAVEGRLSFPSGLTASASVPDRTIAGPAIRNDGGAFSIYILSEPSVSYFTFGIQAAGSSGYNKAVVAGLLIGDNTLITLRASVEIDGW